MKVIIPVRSEGPYIRCIVSSVQDVEVMWYLRFPPRLELKRHTAMGEEGFIQSVSGTGQWQQLVTEAAPLPGNDAMQRMLWIVHHGRNLAPCVLLTATNVGLSIWHSRVGSLFLDAHGMPMDQTLEIVFTFADGKASFVSRAVVSHVGTPGLNGPGVGERGGGGHN